MPTAKMVGKEGNKNKTHKGTSDMKGMLLTTAVVIAVYALVIHGIELSPIEVARELLTR